MSEFKSAVGMFCFKDEFQYIELLGVFTDSNLLPAKFSDWKKKADYGIENLAKKGILVIRVYVETPEEFIVWCRVNGRGIDAKGRTGFAVYKALKMVNKKVGN